MRTYLAETYLSRARAQELGRIAERVGAAARELAAAGIPIRYLRSTFILEDEVCFHVFEGASAEAVREASTRGGLVDVRVLETIGRENPRRSRVLAHRGDDSII